MEVLSSSQIYGWNGEARGELRNDPLHRRKATSCSMREPAGGTWCCPATGFINPSALLQGSDARISESPGMCSKMGVVAAAER